MEDCFMVHKSSLIPGLSKFIDENVLAHYPATSMKRILMAGGVSLYLKQNEGAVDTLTSNPLFKATGIVHDNGMIDIDSVKDALKREVAKAGFMRASFPMVGDIDFTTEDIDALYRFILEANTQTNSAMTTPALSTTNNVIGVY
jgi:hypothetical protein